MLAEEAYLYLNPLNRRIIQSGLAWSSEAQEAQTLLGGSWVVKSGFIRRVTVAITHIRVLITPLVMTHQPPSRQCGPPQLPWVGAGYGLLFASISNVCCYH